MRLLRTVVAAVLVSGVLLGTSGCSERDVAARVNGEVIKSSELDAQVQALREMSPQMFEGPDGEPRLLEYKQRILDGLINNMLIRQAAEERGITIGDEEVQVKIDELKAQFPEEAQFEQALTQSGMSMEDLKTELRKQLMQEQLLAELNTDTEVTEDEIKNYYDSNKEAQFTENAAARASHILFDEADKATAEEVLAEIRGGGDFAALAEEHSRDVATAAVGGDLGWPSTPYVPEFQQAADALDTGEVSDLVKTQYGWHIIKVTEKREERVLPLAEVRDDIEQRILQQREAEAYQVFLNDLRSGAEIEYVVAELQMPATDPVVPGEGEQP